MNTDLAWGGGENGQALEGFVHSDAWPSHVAYPLPHYQANIRSQSSAGWSPVSHANPERPGESVRPVNCRGVHKSKRKERQEESPDGTDIRQPVNVPIPAPASVSSSAAPACMGDTSSCATGTSNAATLTLQLVPADSEAETHVSRLSCNPWLELSQIRVTKSVKGLLSHLSTKWSCPVGRALVLLPPSQLTDAGMDPSAYWGAAEHGNTTVEGIHRSLGQPYPFQLRYTMLEATPVQPPPLNHPHVSHQQQWQHPPPTEQPTWLPPPEQHPVKFASASSQSALSTDWAPLPECQWAPTGAPLHMDVPAQPSAALHILHTMEAPQQVLQPGVSPTFVASTAAAQYPIHAAGMGEASAEGLPARGGQQEDDMEDPGVPCYNEPDPTFTYHEAGLQSEVPSSCMSRQPHSSTATTTQDWGHSAMGQPVVTAPTFLRPSIPALQHTHTPHIQLLLPEPDDCSLSFLLQSGDSVPPPLLSAAAAASHLPAPTDGDFLTGIPHSLYDGECSLDAFSASMGSQPMQAAPVGPVSFRHLESHISCVADIHEQSTAMRHTKGHSGSPSHAPTSVEAPPMPWGVATEEGRDPIPAPGCSTGGGAKRHFPASDQPAKKKSRRHEKNVAWLPDHAEEAASTVGKVNGTLTGGHLPTTTAQRQAADPSLSTWVRETASAAAASLSVQLAVDLCKGSRTGAPSEVPPLTGGADSQPADADATAPGRGSTSVPAAQRKQKRKPSRAKKPRKIPTGGDSPVSGTGAPAVHATGDGVPSQTQAGAMIQAPEPGNVTDAAQSGRREGVQNSNAAPAAVLPLPGRSRFFSRLSRPSTGNKGSDSPPSQQPIVGGTSSNPASHCLLDGMFTGSMSGFLPAPGDQPGSSGGAGASRLLCHMGDYSDSLLPPSLAQLELPPLNDAVSGWAGPNTAQEPVLALPKRRVLGAPSEAAAPIPEPLLEDGAAYGLEGDMEIGLGSLLGAGGDSWMGIAALEAPHVSCGHIARKPFHMLFPTAS